MKWLINFFKDLFGTITAIIDLVISLITGLINFIINIPTFLRAITSSFASVPSFLLPFLTLSITVTVIFILIGRGKSN